MNYKATCLLRHSGKYFIAFTFLILSLAGMKNSASAQTSNALRRPISPEKPMWLIHIDTWNNADPQKIIDLIPADVRPYVVFNLSLSINHEPATGKWLQVEYGYETVKSWLRTCAENKVWAMVQQSSGGFQHFSDFDLRVYEELYRDYPNLIGFNYAEQFWGYDDPFSVTWVQRMAHFTNLLKLSNKYGGYLTVSWCGNEYSPSINPMAMMKRNPGFASASKQFNKNFILCEKYTTQTYQSDMESLCLGAWLSGFSGQYGIRYDATGWTDATGAPANFTMATAGAPHLEHMMLTGETVIDGPETIPVEQSKEISTGTTADGYTSRRWEMYSQFTNVTLDIFRKVLDGTVRIPSRKEVIDRTKVAIIQDVNSGSNDDIYSTPATLFEGLYRMDADGNRKDNKYFFKKTGRYPTIPVVFQLADAEANSFQLKLNASAYSTRWPSISSKVNELNTLFDKEYSGDIYAGRHENAWVVYNPFKSGQSATGRIPFKYNTCDSLELTFAQYTSGVVKETANELNIYLNNYDNVLNTGLKTDVIKIYGSLVEPTYSFSDRGIHQASIVTKSWSAGVLTITIQHNGALDLRISCSGSGVGRLTNFKSLPVIAPQQPAAYSGPRQYEAENFDYKSISGNVANGVSGTVRNYSALGYLRFGTNSAASIRKKITTLLPGTYKLETRYSASGGEVNSVDLYVNGIKVASPVFAKTASDNEWAVNAQLINLKAGENTIMFSASKAGTYNINFDNMVVSGSIGTTYDFNRDIAGTSATNPPAALMTLRGGTAGVIVHADGNSSTSNVFKAYSGGAKNGTGVADLDLFPGTSDYSVIWKSYSGTPGGKNGFLLRSNGENGACPYAIGMKQGYLFVSVSNADGSVSLEPFVAGKGGISAKEKYTSSFVVGANSPCWFRAAVLGNRMKFECSKDSINWEGGSSTIFTDDLYSGGTTQVLWGFGLDKFNGKIDNITFKSSNLAASKVSLSEFDYIKNQGPSGSQSISVSGRSLSSNALVIAPNNYEVSLNVATGFGDQLSLPLSGDSIALTNVYVRLKAGLIANLYKGELTISSGENNLFIPLTGKVRETVVRLYDFNSDVAGTGATNPPAVNISVATENGATAGVVSYTDATSKASNYLRPYSGGQKNATGALNLNLFPSAADYSVVWKQANGTATSDYKVGMLLRGNSPEGNATSGYVQGLKQGYLFIVYNNGGAVPGRSEFRIYRSTAATSLTTLASVAVNSLAPNAGQPVWYRASVSGTVQPSLKLEYSTDSLTWVTGANTSDPNSSFASGSTQLVWGLAAPNWDSYIDNITQLEIPRPGMVSLSKDVLEDFSYLKGNGPSTSNSFTVSGNSLGEDLLMTAPSGFEIGLDQNGTYSSKINISLNNGVVLPTNVFTRLKAGLDAGEYKGELSLNYTPSGGSTDKTVVLTGKVSEPSIIVETPSLLNDLGYVSGYNSVIRNFSVSASSLGLPIQVSASSDFELSLSPESAFTSNLNLSTENGSIQDKQIFVRLKQGLAIGSFSGNITLQSAGAANKTISISGKVSQEGTINVSENSLLSLGYNYYGGTPPVKTFMLWGGPLTSEVAIAAPSNFEVSLNPNSGFAASISVSVSNAVLDPLTVYVRLKSALLENTYSGNISITSTDVTTKTVALNGFVSWSRVYDFSSDIASQSAAAGTSPALNITNGIGNTATAGVVSYTDASMVTSNRFRAYTGGQRNATGVMNLGLYPNNSTDYSVSWKQSIGTANTDYKVGVLLRGNNPVGDASTGYVQGIMNGYVFLAYTANGAATKHSEFRIYRSTSATSLSILVNNSVNSLVPDVGQSLWYRASVSGSSPVSLKLEYSTDSLTWVVAATASDASATAFTAGSTQLLWGVGTPNYNFFVDNISYRDTPVVLPVTYASFSATAEGGTKVRLDWRTVSESLNSGFDIQRSTNGKDFLSIGFVPGKNSTKGTSYTFYDLSAINGKNYYRLRQNDHSGTYTYSQIKMVNTTLGDGSLSAFPNPVASVLNIPSSGEKGSLKVIDLSGKTVINLELSGLEVTQVDVSQLPPGTYIYQTNSKKGLFIKN